MLSLSTNLNLLNNYYTSVSEKFTRMYPSVSKCSSAIKKIFCEQSLFFALNNEAIAIKFHEYKSLSWTQKLKVGLISGLKSVAVALVICKILNFILRGVPSGQIAAGEKVTLFEGLACAVIEEVLFRGVLQNSLACTQKIATYLTPQHLQNNYIFKWLTSPSARITGVSALFAALHLSNGGDYLSTKASFIQTASILLQPIEAILHETTGNIIAPIACHMTHNFLAIIL